MSNQHFKRAEMLLVSHFLTLMYQVAKIKILKSHAPGLLDHLQYAINAQAAIRFIRFKITVHG